jgi:hypothetical protein
MPLVPAVSGHYTWLGISSPWECKIRLGLEGRSLWGSCKLDTAVGRCDEGTIFITCDLFNESNIYFSDIVSYATENKDNKDVNLHGLKISSQFYGDVD